MAKKNEAREVMARIKDMLAQKAAELDAIQQKQEEARGQLEEAGLELKEAVEQTDLTLYEKATADRRKAQGALDMYAARHKMISEKQFITEQESDKVIDGLLEYEKQLTEDFKAAVAAPLKALAAAYEEYMAAVQETEDTLRAWETSIHANYRSSTAVYADGTNRSPKPIPVHSVPFHGCSEAARLKIYLDSAEGLIKE